MVKWLFDDMRVPTFLRALGYICMSVILSYPVVRMIVISNERGTSEEKSLSFQNYKHSTIIFSVATG